ncbi:MAG TPA: Rrf2 family transcriptional regulator [Hyphomicrobiaceae bacterium]|jgi:Rrf2 family nitric oxide-sensitive transcriptional repressor
MRLTRQTSHAIRILIHGARAPDKLIKVADIAGELDITPQNVFKIVHLLARAGFVQAVRGRNGGVRLARDPREIRIGEVVRAMEVMDIALDGEVPRKGKAGSPPINRMLDDALEAFISVLDQHTLADMAGTGRAPGYLSEPKARSPQRNRRRVAAARKNLTRESASPSR